MSDRLATLAIALQTAHDGKSCAGCVYVDRNIAAGMTCSFYDNAPTNAGNWCGIGLLARAPVAEKKEVEIGGQATLFDC